MDDEFAEAVAGALAAQGFVLENLYALLLASDADPVRACQATAHRMLEDFGDDEVGTHPGAPTSMHTFEPMSGVEDDKVDEIHV